jgi:hypothetical protein
MKNVLLLKVKKKHINIMKLKEKIIMSMGNRERESHKFQLYLELNQSVKSIKNI